MAEGKIDKKGYIVMAIVSTGIFMCNIDASMVNIALPSLAKVFNVSTSMVSRISLLDLLAITSFVLVFGSLSDIKGVDRIFALGFIISASSSLLCGLSPDINILLIFRFIHGIGEAMILSTYGAIIVANIHSDIRGRAFSFTSVIGGIALAAGSFFGGIFLKYLSWQWIFLSNIPFGIAGIILVRSFLQGEKNNNKIKNQPFDFPGAVFSFLGLFTLLYALNMGEENVWKSGITIGSFVIALIFIILFITWEKKQEFPMLNFSIFHNLSFTVALLGDFVVLMTLEGCNFLFPFYFDCAHGFTTTKISFLMMIYPVLSTVMSPLAGVMSDKYGKPRIICIFAMIFVIISSIMFTLLGITPSMAYIVFSLIIFGTSITFFFTANTCFEMSQVSPQEEGITSAIISFTSNLASVVGICLFETVYSLNFSYSTPGKTHINIPPAVHIEGFHNACYFAAIICAVGLAGMVLIKPEKSARSKTIIRLKTGRF